MDPTCFANDFFCISGAAGSEAVVSLMGERATMPIPRVTESSRSIIRCTSAATRRDGMVEFRFSTQRRVARRSFDVGLSPSNNSRTSPHKRTVERQERSTSISIGWSAMATSISPIVDTARVCSWGILRVPQS